MQFRGLVGLDVVGEQRAVHQGHLSVDGLDFGVSSAEVGSNEPKIPFARGVHVGEVSFTELVDEVGWVFKVSECHWALLSQGSHDTILEH